MYTAFSLVPFRALARQTMDHTPGIYLLPFFYVVGQIASHIFSQLVTNQQTIQHLIYNPKQAFSFLFSSLTFGLIIALFLKLVAFSISYSIFLRIRQQKEKVSILDSLTLFNHPQFGAILGTLLIKEIVLFLWGLLLYLGLGLLCFVFFLVTAHSLKNGVSQPDQFSEEFLLQIGSLTIISNLLILVGISLFIPQYYAYSQTDFILMAQLEAGHPQKPLLILKESRRLMKGYKLDYIGLDLSFIGWFFLNGISFGLAGIYTIPYYESARIHFFHHMIRDRLAKEQIPTDRPLPL